MTNPIFNPQPNYSGVTIQIANPAVYAGQCSQQNLPYSSYYENANKNCAQTTYPSGYITVPKTSVASNSNIADSNVQNSEQISAFKEQELLNDARYLHPANSYPAQYYMNNYNYGGSGDGNKIYDTNNTKNPNILTKEVDSNNLNQDITHPDNNQIDKQNNSMNSYKIYSQDAIKKESDMTKSQNIIGDLNEREEKIQEEKKNTKETKIVALTDEYIKSLENYLNNPNDEIRLMASKEILTRLDEDKDRYDDAALNALLNKMIQDPNKLVRIAALSALASQLASGNDYTVKLLNNIQSNPNSDKEDVLQAADILLKMSAGVEIKNIPNPSVKNNNEQ